MNQKNYEDLKRTMHFTAFDESFHAPLAKEMAKGKPEFSVTGSRTFGEDRVDAVLNFKKSGENYYFQNYRATIDTAEGQRSQTFYINSIGQSITLKEAGHQLQGKAVQKEFTRQPEPGQQISKGDLQTYKSWHQLDLEKGPDEKGQYPVMRFHENWGFDVEKELRALDLKEMNHARSAEFMVSNLKKGSDLEGTLVVEGREMKVAVFANPADKQVVCKDASGTIVAQSNKQEVKQTAKQEQGSKPLIEKNTKPQRQGRQHRVTQ